MAQDLAILVKAVKVDMETLIRGTPDGRPLLAKPHLLARSVGPHHGQDLPPAPPATPPVPVSRAREAERWRNEGADHHNFTPDYLHPPWPKKTPPGAMALARRGRGGGT